MSVSDLAMSEENWAMKMLCRSGVLTECQHHECVYVEEGNDVVSAYKYGTKVFNEDPAKTPFTILTEARDAIKIAYDVHGGNDVCPHCQKRWEE